MKIQDLAAVTLCVKAAFATPYGFHHRRFHEKRTVVTTYITATKVVTVVDHGAVLIVDAAGNVVSTGYKTSATGTNSAIAVSTTSLSTSVSTSALSTISVPFVETPTLKDESRIIPTSHAESIVPENGVALQAANPKVQKDPNSVNSATAITSSSTIPGFGIAYDAYSSTSSGCRSNLYNEFGFLAAQGITSIRVYDLCFAESIAAAAPRNIRLMIGLTTFKDFDANLAALIASVTSTPQSWSQIDTVFVGNELVNSRAASSADVAAKVSYARGILRSHGFKGAVVTVDTWTAMRSDPTICSTSDFCAVNAHSFFDGKVLPTDAGKFVRMAQSLVSTANGGKRVVVTESGWPHAGAAFNLAVPSVENQRLAMASVVKEFATSPGDMFLFMAYDAKYKTGADEVERNFGLFDSGVPLSLGLSL